MTAPRYVDERVPAVECQDATAACTLATTACLPGTVLEKALRENTPGTEFGERHDDTAGLDVQLTNDVLTDDQLATALHEAGLPELARVIYHLTHRGHR
jgi:hypothetical protein